MFANGDRVSWSGTRVIAWFMKFISHKSFMPSSDYRIALGIVIRAGDGGRAERTRRSRGLSHSRAGAKGPGSGSIPTPLAT